MSGRLRALADLLRAGGMLPVVVLGVAAAVAFGLAIAVLVLTAGMPLPPPPAGHH